MTGPSKVPTDWATNYPVPIGWMRQFRYFAGLYDQIQNVRGEVVECGLGEGNTFAMLAYFIGSEERQPKRKLLGFDSFEGWPEPDPSDASPRHPTKGEWKVNRGMVERRFEESGLDREFPTLNISMTGGFLRDTLPKFPSDYRIAFLHLDVDLYEGYRDGLANLFPRVSSGGIIAFDEYKEFPAGNEGDAVYGGKIEKWPGCTKAIDEYFSGSSEVIRYHPETKKYYIVKGSK